MVPPLWCRYTKMTPAGRGYPLSLLWVREHLFLNKVSYHDAWSWTSEIVQTKTMGLVLGGQFRFSSFHSCQTCLLTRPALPLVLHYPSPLYSTYPCHHSCLIPFSPSLVLPSPSIPDFPLLHWLTFFRQAFCWLLLHVGVLWLRYWLANSMQLCALPTGHSQYP